MVEEDLPDVPDEPTAGEPTDGASDEGAAAPASEALRKAFQNRRAKASGEEPEELTQEEQEALRKSFENLRRALNPLANIKMPNYTLPASVVKNMQSALGAYSMNNSVIQQALRNITPALTGQQNWLKQYKGINSDLIKTMGVFQVQMQPVLEQLTKNVDFSVLGQYAKLTEQLRAQQASWFKDIIPDLVKLKEAFWPPNLRGIEALDLEDVEAVVLLDGIGLYGVPRRTIAEALILADSAAKRREILGRRWKAISADCREAMEACKSRALAPYVPAALAALDALDGGHNQAAQALVGSLIDSILIAYLGDKRYLYTPNKRTKNSDAYKEFGIRKFIALAPMWQAYQQFWARNGDAVPTTFTRNATAHTVSNRQFNRRNTVQGLLFACGLITFLEDQARRSEA